MKLLDSIRDRLARKVTCYQCGARVSHTHHMQHNFHGTLTQIDVCDACHEKLRRRQGQGGGASRR